MNTDEFGKALQDIGIYEFSGVPCSYLSPLINYAINCNHFIMANNEGDAVAIATGISLSQRNKNIYGCVLMQNSGLSNALSPLTSLNHTFCIPILGFVSLRGQRDDNGMNTDEPQHELLGIITDKILDLCDIGYEFLSDNIVEAKLQLKRAKSFLDSNKSFFFIVRHNTFSSVALQNNPDIYPDYRAFIPFVFRSDSLINFARLDALKVIQENTKDCIVIATTGKCGRELYELGDRHNQFYMVGSMGCIGALGLGISLNSNKKVVAIDGDSALLMRLGALSTNAYYSQQCNRSNFCHILLDNHSHDSTGGQFNLSPIVDFPNIAICCGYDVVNIVNDLEELENSIKSFMQSNSGGAYFIYMRIKKGSKENLGRPKITPKEVGFRLSKFINN